MRLLQTLAYVYYTGLLLPADSSRSYLVIYTHSPPLILMKIL